MALPLLLLKPGLLLRTLHPRVPQPLLSLSIATETLTIDAVRAYTKPDELLEHLQQLDNEGNNHLQRLLATSYVCNGEHVLAEPFVSAALAEDPHDIEMRFLQVDAACVGGSTSELVAALWVWDGSAHL